MNLMLRLAIAITACISSMALGWWIHQPPSLAGKKTDLDPGSRPTVISTSVVPDDEALSSKIAGLDPFGLKRNEPLSPSAAGIADKGASAAADMLTWRVAALVVRGGERFLLLTSPGQTPLRVAEGDKLPDGDKVTSIQADRAVIQSVKGRTRTIHLTEP